MELALCLLGIIAAATGGAGVYYLFQRAKDRL